jgi:hypothetical protein
MYEVTREINPGDLEGVKVINVSKEPAKAQESFYDKQIKKVEKDSNNKRKQRALFTDENMFCALPRILIKPLASSDVQALFISPY